jgi:Na+-driven multidrug efflux pump
VRELVRLGVPSALEQSTSSLAMILMTAMVATFPPAVVAAYGLGNRLLSLAFLPAMGLGQAMNTVVGQNLGARRPDRADRAVRAGMGVVAAVMTVVAAVAVLVPGPIVGLFLSTGGPRAAATAAHATDFLRVAAAMFVFMGVLQVVLGAFRGAGRTKTALAFSMVTLWVARLPAAYLLVFVLGWGATGVWWAVAVGDVVGCLAAVAWLRRGTWRDAVVAGSGRRPRERDPDVAPAD